MNNLRTRQLVTLTTLVATAGLWVLTPKPTIGQSNPPVSAAQSAELAEADRLEQQAGKLENQRKYNEAIPLRERVLNIRKKVLGDNRLDLVTSLNYLAGLYQSQRRYTEAESLYRQALAIIKRRLGEQDLEVANSLNYLADLYQSQERYAEAESLYRQALAIIKRQLGEQDLEVVTSLNYLADLYQSQKLYAEAEPLLRQALAIIKREFGEKAPLVADHLNRLAALYQSQERYTEAESLYRQALEMKKRQLGEQDLEVAISLNELAGVYDSQGRYADAEPLYRQALAIIKRQLGEQHPYVATSLNNLALLYQTQGRYAEAEPLLHQALAIIKRQLGEQDLEVATSLNSLAAVYHSQGRYTEAESLYRQALEMRKRQLGEQHPDAATSLSNLAMLYERQGRYAEAEPLLRQALEIRKRRLGNEHSDVAQSLNNLAGVYYSQGRYAEAEPLLRQALEIRKRRLGNEHPDVAQSLNNLAGVYNSQGRYAEAEPLYRQALEMRKRLLGEQHPSVANSLINLVFLYWQQHNTSRALEFFTQQITVEEHNLTPNLAVGFERQKRDYVIHNISGTTNASISLNLNFAPNNPIATSLALNTVLQRKGRILDVVTNSQQILRQNLDSQSQTLLTNLENAQTQLANLFYNRPEKLPLEQYRTQVAQLETQVKQLEDQLSRRSQEFRTQSQRVTIETIQTLIPADAALVEIVRYRPVNPKAAPDEGLGKPRYAVYVLSAKGEPKGIDLGDAATVEQTLVQFRDDLRDQNTPISQVKQSARELDKILMQPVRKLLGNTRKILLSPDSQLNLIPFEALVDENNRYLVENYSFTYLTSGRDLLRVQNKPASKQPPVIIADPNFNRPGELVARQTQSNVDTKNTRSIDLSQKVFSPLPGTAQEAKAIASLLKIQPLTDTKATEGAVKQVNGPRILHIATHGFFENTSANEEKTIVDDNPLLQSGLVLAGLKPRQSSGEDGILTALETTALNLVGTKLVVLSACDTGLGNIFAGEGVYGLRRALVIAGSESQVISLWKVADDATKDFMVAYYQRLLDNQGRSEALRQTQLEMLNGEKYQHPYFWAAFIPSGDWKPMGK
ncbi:tetratricopeptide repeat protein [Calothrix membranacea FACHB-236]|nr:tetratricopeptide repeat protein [Calothrix membranacea FACHB-236]